MMQPNIVLITIDSLRADHCGFLNGKTLTPKMDQIASNGVTFTNAITPGPTTLDSMPVIFTGEEIHERRRCDSVEEATSHHMQARDTLPERLQRMGYETGGFTTNPWTARPFGFQAGFDYFEDFTDTDQDNDDGLTSFLSSSERKTTAGLGYAIDMFGNWIQEDDMFRSFGAFYDDVLEWTRLASQPYFLWLFLVDVHMPYLPPRNWRRNSHLGMYLSNLWMYSDSEVLESLFKPRLLKAYEDTIRSVDAKIGQLHRDLPDETAFVIHADHGEEFGKDGKYGHGTHLNEVQTRVPLIVDTDETGRIDEPISLACMPELVTDIASGRNVSDLPNQIAHTQNFDPKRAVRFHNWKLVKRDSEYSLSYQSDEDPMADPAEAFKFCKQLIAHREQQSQRRAIISEATKDIADSHKI